MTASREGLEPCPTLASIEREVQELFDLAGRDTNARSEPREHWVAAKLREIADKALATRPEPEASGPTDQEAGKLTNAIYGIQEALSTLQTSHPAARQLRGVMRDLDALRQPTGEPTQASEVSGLGKWLRHDGLCGIVGGYGYCTCGLDEALAALRTQPTHATREDKAIRITEADFERAAKEVAYLQSNLDITNADHIALWIEHNTIPDEPMNQCASWLACRIVEAHEAATREVSEEQVERGGTDK